MKRDLVDPSFTIGVFIILLVSATALFAPFLAPKDPEAISLMARLTPPNLNGEYPLGADAIGRDLLSRIIFGSRISLTVGLVSVAVAALVGTLVGLIAGYFGGVLDAVLMRIADIQLAFPFILLAITVIAVIGPGLWKLIFVMALAQWVQYARIVRAQVLSLKEQDYIQAATGLGASTPRILLRHIFINALTPVTVLAPLNVANNILVESGLTFLGLGVDPTIPSWGGMLADGRSYIESAWWVTTYPGLAIALTVLGFNLLGDWLRDRFDPRVQRS